MSSHLARSRFQVLAQVLPWKYGLLGLAKVFQRNRTNRRLSVYLCIGVLRERKRNRQTEGENNRRERERDLL